MHGTVVIFVYIPHVYSTLYQLWSRKSKPLLSDHFQSIHDLHPYYEKAAVMGMYIIHVLALHPAFPIINPQILIACSMNNFHTASDKNLGVGKVGYVHIHVSVVILH